MRTADPDVLRIAGVVRESIVDGPGIRFAVFCQGCPHNCPGCHNPETHDPEGGYDIPVARIMEEISKDPILKGVTFSGGEPMCQPEAFFSLGKMVKASGLDLMVFSGYTYEEIMKLAEENDAVRGLMDICDYLVDGRFVLAKRDLTLRFRGSSNQRFIDMNATRVNGVVTSAEQPS